MSDGKKNGGDGIKKINPVTDNYLKVFGAYLALTAAIDRGGYDVSPCLICQQLVVCIPDGLAMCLECVEKCAEKASKEG